MCFCTSKRGSSLRMAASSSRNWSLVTMTVAALLLADVQCRRASLCRAVATFTCGH